jgi:hypothetical protein
MDCRCVYVVVVVGAVSRVDDDMDAAGRRIMIDD